MKSSVEKPSDAVPAVPNVSMRFEAITDYGSILISEHVISSVVKKAACAVSGVTRLAGKSSFMNTVSGMMHGKRNLDHAIRISIDGNNVEVEVRVNVAYDENIPKLALIIQNTIAEEIKMITGMNVTKVNVIVNEVEARERVVEGDPSDTM